MKARRRNTPQSSTGQTSAVETMNMEDEITVVLRQDDLDHIPDIFYLFRLVNEYKKTPTYKHREGDDYHLSNEEKSDVLISDMQKGKYKNIIPAYHKASFYIARFIYYYGRHIEPIKFEYESGHPGYLTPYGEIIRRETGFHDRNLDQFVPNYERVRDYVLNGLQWYYRHDPLRGDIINILNNKLGDITGEQYLTLLEEDRRRTMFLDEISDLY